MMAKFCGGHVSSDEYLVLPVQDFDLPGNGLLSPTKDAWLKSLFGGYEFSPSASLPSGSFGSDSQFHRFGYAATEPLSV